MEYNIWYVVVSRFLQKIKTSFVCLWFAQLSFVFISHKRFLSNHDIADALLVDVV